jgi:hypothetical protein
MGLSRGERVKARYSRSGPLPCSSAGLVICVAEEMSGARTEDQALLNWLRWSGMGGVVTLGTVASPRCPVCVETPASDVAAW